jgi:uncharacterized protein YjgD (DUF1641 family)
VARPIHSVASEGHAEEVPEPIGVLEDELTKDREAMLHFLELIRLLDEKGVLRIATDFAANNEELLRVSVDWLSRPGTLRAIQNLRVLLEALERIDPKRLEKLITEAGHAADLASQVGPPGRRVGVLALLRQLGDPETNRGLRVLLAALKDFGSKNR